MNPVVAYHNPPPLRQVYSDPIVTICQNAQGLFVDSQNQALNINPQNNTLLWPNNNLLVRTISGLAVQILQNGCRLVDLNIVENNIMHKDRAICVLRDQRGLLVDANYRPFCLSPEGYLMSSGAVLRTEVGASIQKLQNGGIVLVPQQTQVPLPHRNLVIQMPPPRPAAGVTIGGQPTLQAAVLQPPVAQQSVAPQALSVEDAYAGLQSGSEDERVQYWLTLPADMRDKVLEKFRAEEWVAFGGILMDHGVMTRQSIVDALINAAADNTELKLFLIAYIKMVNAKAELSVD